MTQENLLKLAMAAGATFAIYKFAPSSAVKAAALGVMGVIVARQLPIVGPALA